MVISNAVLYNPVMKKNISAVILIVVLIVAVVFLVIDQFKGSTVSIVTSSSTPQNAATSSTTDSSVNISAWKAYTSLGQPAFSIKYPPDLVSSVSVVPTIDGPYLLALQFPKDVYFSTVLKDEADVIVTASSTCPTVEPGPIDHGPQTIDMNGLTFTENQVSDVAAGNRYLTITYDTIANNRCYRITFFDHGANGAGLYLSDPAAIKAADSAHDAELARIESIVSAMVSTFGTAASQ